MKNKIILLITILLILGTIPKAWRFVKTLHTDSQPFTAYYENVTYDNKIPDIQLSGELKPYYNSEIYSKIDGILEKRFVNIGDNVKQGEMLAIISAPLIDSDKTMAQKSLTEAQYRQTLAHDTYTRYQKAFKDGAISPQEMQTKETDYQTAQIEYKIALASLKRANSMQNYEYIKAPFSGVITKYNLDSGANVVAGGSTTSTLLFEISQIDKLRLRIDIPQSYIDRVKLNQKIKFFVPEEPDKIYIGTLSKLSKSFDATTRTMKAEITVENKDLKLFAGQYVKTIIPFETKNKMLLVKNSAIITDENGSRVLTVDDNNILHFKKVEIGKDFGDVVEITKGLSEKDRIVVNYNDNLKDGQKVLSKEAKQANF